MVVCGEKSLCPQLWVVVNILYHRPGDRDSVICARSTSNFIQNEQAAGSGIVENGGSLNHLNHKGGLTRMDFILGAHSSEDAINQTDTGRFCGNEAAYLSQQVQLVLPA